MQQQQENMSPFPTGLKVLVVDDDPLCLKVIEQMLRRCNYKVTTCQSSTLALDLLRKDHQAFDIVLSDVYMPDMDGFKLLELIGLELGLPVIMMSSNGDTNVVFRGVTHGAVDFLIKPVRVEELRNLWQHVVRKTLGTTPNQDRGHSEEVDDDELKRAERKRKDVKHVARELLEEGGSNPKKQRVVWSVEMHQQFVNAVNQLGIDKAVPKRILDLMNVEGLTRENVASHLQKYRLYLKRVQGINPSSSKNSSKGQKPEAPASVAMPAMLPGHPAMPMGMMPPAMMLGLAEGAPFIPGFMPGMIPGMPPGAMLPPGLPGLPPGMPGMPPMMGMAATPMMPGGLPGMMPPMQAAQQHLNNDLPRNGSAHDHVAQPQGLSPEPGANGMHPSPSNSNPSMQSQMQQQQAAGAAGAMMPPIGGFSAPPGGPAGLTMEQLQQGMMAMAQQGMVFPGMMPQGINGLTPQQALQQQMAAMAMQQQQMPNPTGSGGGSSVAAQPNGMGMNSHAGTMHPPAAQTPCTTAPDAALQHELAQLCQQVDLGNLRSNTDLDCTADPLASIGGVLGGLSEAATMDLGRGEGPPDEFLAFLLKDNVMD